MPSIPRGRGISVPLSSALEFPEAAWSSHPRLLAFLRYCPGVPKRNPFPSFLYCRQVSSAGQYRDCLLRDVSLSPRQKLPRPGTALPAAAAKKQNTDHVTLCPYAVSCRNICSNM